MASTRSRPFEVIFYGSLKELAKILRLNAERIAHYAYILHDLDVYEEDGKEDENGDLSHKKGDLKRAHYHVLVDYYNTHTFTAVKKMFTTTADNPRVEAIVSRQAKFEYLTHKGYPEKFQYAESEIVSDDIEYWHSICRRGDVRDTDNLADVIVRDIVKGVSPWVLIQRYGRDYVIHRRQFEEMADCCKNWDLDHPKQGSKRAELVEVYGNAQDEIPFDD